MSRVTTLIPPPVACAALSSPLARGRAGNGAPPSRPVQAECSGASTTKRPHRLTPAAGSLSAGLPRLFPILAYCDITAYFISFLLFGILKDAKGWNYPQTSEVASQLRFHTLFGTRANIGILISLATAVFAWYVLQKTKFGFLVNTIGGNTRAALYSGLHVKKIQSLLFTVSGAIAGLAGGILIAGVEGRMRVDSGANMGFFGFLAAGIVACGGRQQ